VNTNVENYVNYSGLYLPRAKKNKYLGEVPSTARNEKRSLHARRKFRWSGPTEIFFTKPPIVSVSDYGSLKTSIIKFAILTIDEKS
jgi:hypothetical protein